MQKLLLLNMGIVLVNYAANNIFDNDPRPVLQRWAERIEFKKVEKLKQICEAKQKKRGKIYPHYYALKDRYDELMQWESPQRVVPLNVIRRTSTEDLRIKNRLHNRLHTLFKRWTFGG